MAKTVLIVEDDRNIADLLRLYLEKEGYTETSVQHTLHPAASAQESLGGRNMTSVKDCGTLLENIYPGARARPMLPPLYRMCGQKTSTRAETQPPAPKQKIGRPRRGRPFQRVKKASQSLPPAGGKKVQSFSLATCA